jgi:hypothetical protein
MAEYRIVNYIPNFDGVERIEDNAFIPNDERNKDWLEYQEWLAKGNEPDTAVKLEPR